LALFYFYKAYNYNMSKIEDFPAENLITDEKGLKLVRAAGFLTVGDFLNSDPTTLFVVAAKHGLPAYPTVGIFNDFVHEHGSDFVAAPPAILGMKAYIPDPPKIGEEEFYVNDPEREEVVKKILE